MEDFLEVEEVNFFKNNIKKLKKKEDKNIDDVIQHIHLDNLMEIQKQIEGKQNLDKLYFYNKYIKY